MALGMSSFLGREDSGAAHDALSRLNEVQTFCFDKTGTLTRNEMTVREVFTPGVSAMLLGSGYEPKGALTVDGLAVEGFATEQDRFTQAEVVDPPGVCAASRPVETGRVSARNDVQGQAECSLDRLCEHGQLSHVPGIG